MPRLTTEADHVKKCGERAAGALIDLEMALNLSESLPIPDKEQLATLTAGLQISIAGLNGRLQNVFQQCSKAA